MKTGMRKKSLAIISYLTPSLSKNTEPRLSVQSQDLRVILAWAGGQKSPYCSLCYCFPALPWASHCLCFCPPFSDLCCGEDWPHHCQMLGALPLAAAELPIHSSCLHHNSLLKRKAVRYAYLKRGWKNISTQWKLI